MSTGSDRFQHLLDERDIARLEPLFCRAIDRRDLALLLSLFHADATERRGDREIHVHGEAAGQLGYMVAHFLSTFHSVTQSLVDVRGDRAISESYYLSRVLLPAEHETLAQMFGATYLESWTAEEASRPFTILSGGRYLSRYVRDGAVWRFIGREVLNEWNECGPSRQHYAGGMLARIRAPMPSGKPDPLTAAQTWMAAAMPG